MANFVGSSDSLLLFTNGAWGVVVDSETSVIVASGASSVLESSRKWVPGELNADAAELASLSLTTMAVTAGASSKYTIPKAAQSEAKKALEWRKENKRGGTDVGLNTARTLAKGGQIGIEKVRHISKYFARHEVDKKGKGWSPGEDGFPSNGRIAWALWGGDAAWRWARAIVEREDKKALRADGYGLQQEMSMGPDISEFELDETIDGPEFLTRVRLDGSGMDRLYKMDHDGSCYVWDDGRWDDLGVRDGNIWDYDNELDDMEDHCEKSHIEVDPESAIVIAAKLFANPKMYVTIEDIDAHEAEMAKDAINEIDWEILDRAIVAAGEVNPEDGIYSEEERSKNATQQVRDKTGKFAKAGGRVMVAGDPKNGIGTVTGTNKANGTVTVKLDNGNTVEVPGKAIEPLGGNVPTATTPVNQEPLDLSGILGEPRTPANRAQAQLPGTLPAMTSQDLKMLVNDWPAYVQSQREQYSPISTPNAVPVQGRNSKSTGPMGQYMKDRTGKEVMMDAYDHPLLNKWLNRKDSGGYYPNQLWYQPLNASASETLLTPETSDVQPVYMAVVDPEDTRAVLSLVSLVPASSTSNAPMVYTRKQGKWVRDPKTMADLNSATPPPVIPLDTETLNDVLTQVDETQGVGVTASIALTVLFGNDVSALVAAGGMDRNRGNAEKLRLYWTKGQGAAKIKWGVGGDWKRCVRFLAKHMGVRSKGYCQLRHKEALGYYTATHAKMDRAGAASAGYEDPSSEMPITTVEPEDMHIPLEAILTEQDSEYDDTWEPEEEILLIMSDPEQLNYEEFSLIAAGGLDRNRGNAEKLRRYWTVGKGGAKIRWGTGGDWTRCVRNLKKYLGTRAKGYCALRHKEMNGMWPGDRRNQRDFSIDGTVLRPEESVIEMAVLKARKADARAKFALIAGVAPAEVDTFSGARFVIPLVIPEDMESGDGRRFKKGAIEIRDLPLPLLWQIQTGSGHDGSVVVGRIDGMERTENGIGNAYGVFDTGAYGKEAERLVREGFLRGVSADMDKFEATEEVEEVAASEDSEDDKKIEKQKIVISNARVMAVTIVPKPAFQECKIILADELEEDPQEEEMISDGVYVENVDPVDAEAVVASGMIAGAIPTTPPKNWFDNPKLTQPTPLTVTDDGRVFGHIASWQVDHIGMPAGTKPPKSRSNYGYFHTGVCRTAEGADIPVGQITLAGGHADITASAAAAVKHYDDTASAVIDCHAGEDSYGIWVAGALRPGTTPEQIRALRASAPSGDWRPIQGKLELVAVCQVNVPGFPIARAMVAGGQITALVAAGASAMARLRENPVQDLANRLSKIEEKEQKALVATAEQARAKFQAMTGTKTDAEAVVADGMYHEVEPTLVPVLSDVLSDVVAFSFIAQGYHWNVKGSNFPQYHDLFGEIYEDAHSSVDPLGENILKLGYDAPFTLATFAAMSELSGAATDMNTCEAMAYDLYKSNEVVLRKYKAAFQVANAANEQGIADFLAGRIDMHDKWSWQLKSSVMPAGIEEAEYAQIDEPYELVFATMEKQGVLEAGLLASADDRVARSESLDAILEFAEFSPKQREELAKKGEAMPDGSYPIRNVADLKNAIKAYGRSALKERQAVRKHIIKRAKALDSVDLIPEQWANPKNSPNSYSVEELRNRISEFSTKADS